MECAILHIHGACGEQYFAAVDSSGFVEVSENGGFEEEKKEDEVLMKSRMHIVTFFLWSASQSAQATIDHAGYSAWPWWQAAAHDK